MSTSNVVNNLAAHAAIVELLNRYTDAINQRNWIELKSVFAEDCVWDMGGPSVGSMAMRFEGAQRVCEGIAAAIDTAELCVQTNHAPVIVVEGTCATARSTIQEIVRPKGGGGIMILGAYHDDIVLCDDGEWRFKERRFRIRYMDMSPLTGNLIPA
ncbi:MAG: nuclear transport factor 2 family protein [Steroidobacteraceae bacterium]